MAITDVGGCGKVISGDGVINEFNTFMGIITTLAGLITRFAELIIPFISIVTTLFR